jgi:membrane peptidoglycan carboxypeptidase
VTHQDHASPSGDGRGLPGRAALRRVVAAARRAGCDYPRSGRRGWRRWVPSWRQSLALALLSVCALTGLVAVAYALTPIPSDLNSFATQQDNVYYWADGTEMARTGQTDRQAVPLARIPQSVQWAVLAAENATFYTDDGVSPKGISRAAYEMAKGGSVQGGSTITEQYVKNAYLNQNQTFTRKFTEMIISVKLNKKLTKQQILQSYLNTSWFGRGTYGIERAAKAYYGEDVSQLNVSQGAFLASLLKGAGLYDPSIGPANRQRAVTRWNWILDRMVKIGRLSPAQRAAYKTFPEPIAPPRTPSLTGQVGYLQETAEAYVLAHSGISARRFDLGGYQVFTTFRKPQETALTASVRTALGRLDPRHRAGDRDVRVGAASVGTDGGIEALYGGPGYLQQGFDDADSTIVPAGTSFTPFVYAAALQQGVRRTADGPRQPVSPSTRYDGDNGVDLDTPEGPYWSRDGKIVKGVNDGRRSWGSITLRESVAQSVNSVALQLGTDTGLDRVRETAVRMGLLPGSMGEQVPQFALGNSTPSAIRMADAYATVPAGGRHTEPYSVLRVTRGGVPVAVDTPAGVQALSPAVAAEVGDALTDAVRHGTAKAARVLGPGVAGKTGTTADDRAAWFVGYDSRITTAVSFFRVDPRTQGLLSLKHLGGASDAQVADSDPVSVFTDYMTAVDGHRTAPAAAPTTGPATATGSHAHEG